MALQKQNVSVNFTQGLETKSDPKQVALGKFLALENSLFDKTGQLTKRYGFDRLSALDADVVATSTFAGGLLAYGSTFQMLSSSTDSWFNKGPIHPVQVDVLPAVRTSSSQNTVDTAVASNGLVCTVWFDADTHTYFQVIDGDTGDIVVSRTDLSALSTGTVGPRVFALGRYFVVVYQSATANHLAYKTINIYDPTIVSAEADISTDYGTGTYPFDGLVSNDSLFIAFRNNGNDLKLTKLSSTLVLYSAVTVEASSTPVTVSLSADDAVSPPNIFVSYYNAAEIKTRSYSPDLVARAAAVVVLTVSTVIRLTTFASSDTLTAYYQIQQNYSYTAVRSDYISTVSKVWGGASTTPAVVVRGVGISSKPFAIESTGLRYMLVAYSGAYQPTYFLITTTGQLVAKLAYSNGGGYTASTTIPSVYIDGDIARIGYLFKDLILPLNKTQQTASPIAGVYTQTGINIATFDFSQNVMTAAEIGNNLHLGGGIMWMYDGAKPVEHNFMLFPETLVAATVTTTGNMKNQLYYYAVTYEWTDAQGNIHRSAPSVPLAVDLSGSATITNKVTLNIPYLRLTYKATPNPVRLVIYRWSTDNQAFYQITSITSPQLNVPTSDSLAYADTVADSTIIGNPILYTTGGVIENVAFPPVSDMALFKSRLVAIDAEDKNLLWYSRQVIEGVPVEPSDLLTIFVAPTTASQGPTGPMTTLSAMDDKLIIFKRNSIYYETGNGPDNTGANNDFFDPVFVTSAVGCTNKQSIVFTPVGLMFQSDKGIWLLKRDLSTDYIGAPVEAYNGATVVSALNIPGTNQVRFTLDSGITLMYDYYFNQWGTFTGIPGISSCLYQNKHTFINSTGQVYQESTTSYKDGSRPVLLKFTTAWIQLAGLQGYERAYFFYLLGQFITPHKLSIDISYDYVDAPSQSLIITPDNYNVPYGDITIYGGDSPYGSTDAIEQWRIFLKQQKCQAFKLTIREIYDGTYDVPAGAGLTLSGLNIVTGIKSGYPRLKSSRSIG